MVPGRRTVEEPERIPELERFMLKRVLDIPGVRKATLIADRPNQYTRRQATDSLARLMKGRQSDIVAFHVGRSERLAVRRVYPPTKLQLLEDLIRSTARIQVLVQFHEYDEPVPRADAIRDLARHYTPKQAERHIRKLLPKKGAPATILEEVPCPRPEQRRDGRRAKCIQLIEDMRFFLREMLIRDAIGAGGSPMKFHWPHPEATGPQSVTDA